MPGVLARVRGAVAAPVRAGTEATVRVALAARAVPTATEALAGPAVLAAPTTARTAAAWAA